MSGLFVAIVGPSGAGKDALIRAIVLRSGDDPRFVAVRRIVTRVSDASEDHLTLDEDAFVAAERAQKFALSWGAHGLRYGVPIEVDDALRAGKTVICNLSRGAVDEARRRWPFVLAVLVTARPQTLAQRIAARGRESVEDARERLARAAAAEAAMTPDAIIDNDGALAEAAERLFALIGSRARTPA